MKFKNCGKLILFTVLVALLAFIPMQPSAVTKYNFTRDTQNVNYLNTVAIRFNNNCYTIVKNQNQPNNIYHAVVVGKQNQTTNNCYVISRGNYIINKRGSIIGFIYTEGLDYW
jgi:hypothetical protein